MLSVLAAALAAASFCAISFSAQPLRVVFMLVAAGCIQLRLLTNMLDGLIAVESGRHTPTGDLFNEIPDRVDDLLILGGAGFAIATLWGIALGVTCAILAVLTAYVRLLAGSLGLPQRFLGPMAKPHRMATLTAACLAAALECALTGQVTWSVSTGLAVIALGSLITLVRRVRVAAADLRSR